MTETSTEIDHAADVAALRALVDDVEVGFNTNDAERMVRGFADDGTAVGVTGALLRGRDEMLDVSRDLLAGPLRDQRARYELDDIRFVRPDVALGYKRAWAVDADGHDLDVGHAMVALYVFVREGDRWEIAARQNTLVS